MNGVQTETHSMIPTRIDIIASFRVTSKNVCLSVGLWEIGKCSWFHELFAVWQKNAVAIPGVQILLFYRLIGFMA